MTNSYDNNSGKKIGAWILGSAAVIAVCAAAIYLIDVDQTQEARLPTVDVDVSAETGQMPEFDVDVADVNLGTTQVGVSVPNVDVETKTIEIEVPVDMDADMDETSISLPTIDIDRPEADDPANN